MSLKCCHKWVRTDDSFPQSKERHKRSFLEISTTEASPKTECDEEETLESSLWGAIANNSSMSILDELDSIKDEILFECFTLYAASHYAAKKFAKMMK